MLQDAIENGVTVVEHCSVVQVNQKELKVSSVDTSGGTIKCKYFVNCAGFWARNIGNMSDPIVKIPLHPVEHYYLHTKNIPALRDTMPVVRDLDGQIYFREYDGKIMAGGYELNAKPAFDDGNFPLLMSERELPPDWDHFQILLEELLKRVPMLRGAILEKYNIC